LTRLGATLCLFLGNINKELLLPSIIAFLSTTLLLDTILYQSIRLAIDRSLPRSLVDDTNQQSGVRLWALEYSLTNAAIFITLMAYDFLREYSPNYQTANALNQALGTAAAGCTCMILIVSNVCFPPAPARPKTLPAMLEEERQKDTNPCCYEYKRIFVDGNFWRFVVFCTVILAVASILRHMDQTLPVLMKRLFTDSVHFARVQAINPVLIIILAPCLQWLTDKQPSYRIIAMGSSISSFSVLILAIFSTHTPPPAHIAGWLDYAPYIVFMMVFSVGEALWSPRLTFYMFDITPDDQKATYQAVSRVPGIIARLIAAWHSALLVETYCPSAVYCQPRMLWVIVWLFSAITPFCLAVGFRCIYPRLRRSTVSLFSAPVGLI